MNAASSVRETGGLPEHIDAIAQPNSSVLEGIVMWHYPPATYCTMRGIQSWIDPLIDRAAEVHRKDLLRAAAAGKEAPEFSLPLEVMLMQIYAFAQPRQAYAAYRNGEASYVKAVFNWAEADLAEWGCVAKAEYGRKLGTLYRFVLEQCGILEAATNPQELAPETPAAESATPEGNPQS